MISLDVGIKDKGNERLFLWLEFGEVSLVDLGLYIF